MKITLDEMQTFVTVVDSGSITAAAEVLDQTTSAASRTLSRLEEKLHTTLLSRTTRRLQLTEEGAAFLMHARTILDSVCQAEEQMAARRAKPAGRLRVDAATPFMLHVLVPLIEGFCARYPEVQLELTSNEGFTDLLEKRTDVAFRIGDLRDSTLHARMVGVSRLRILASPAYLKRCGTPTDASELANHCLLGFTQPTVLNEWPLYDADGNVLRVTPSVASSSGETLSRLALAGLGIVCLSDFMSREHRDGGQLVEILADKVLDMRKPVNAVYYRNTAVAARIVCFVDHVIEALGKKPFSE